jgi:micrococcal nuclease
LRRRVVLILLALAAAGTIAVVADATRGSGTSGLVTAVTAGDTLQVKLANGKSQTVRVLGVVAPRTGACYATEAADATRTLAVGKTVRLSGTGATAYVTLPDGTDLGRALVDGGFAQVDAWGPSFSRFASYVPLQQAAETANKGIWGACAADVSVTLTSNPDTVGVGGRIVYTATVANAGPLPAPDVSLDARAPDGTPFDTAAGVSAHTSCTAHGWYATCDLATIPPGGSVVATFDATAKKESVVSASAVVRLSGCGRAACGQTPIQDTNLANDRVGVFTTIVPAGAPVTGVPHKLPLDHWVENSYCDPHYPTVCIPSPPPKIDCADLSFRAFKTIHYPAVNTPDPNALDNDFDGVGCTFNDY